MRYALCNEMFENVPMAEVCATVADLGYHGLEVAPFTLAKNAADISADLRRETRRIIEDTGLECVGLHWLLAHTEGLHMTQPDDAVGERTRDYFRTLIDLCADLNGKVMVVGSPMQRSIEEGQTQEGGWKRAVELFASVVDHAGDAGVTIAIEPLAPAETNFINTVTDGMRMVRDINHPNFKVHLDVKAMSSEPQPVADVIRSVTVDDIGHFHVNDPNLYGPGMGDVEYGPIMDACREVGWDSWLSVEVFKYDPDPVTIARKSIEYLRSFE